METLKVSRRTRAPHEHSAPRELPSDPLRQAVTRFLGDAPEGFSGTERDAHRVAFNRAFKAFNGIEKLEAGLTSAVASTNPEEGGSD